MRTSVDPRGRSGSHQRTTALLFVIAAVLPMNTIVRQSPKRAGRLHRLRLLLDLCELASGRDNPRLFSRRIELLEVGDDVVNLLWIFQAWKSHFGAGYLGFRILDVFTEGCFIPGDSGILVRG